MKPKIEIEKGIPRPKRYYGSQATYPFDKMEIDDSFKIEIKENEKRSLVQSRIWASLKYYRTNVITDKKFVTRVINNYVRCWRIK